VANSDWMRGRLVWPALVSWTVALVALLVASALSRPAEDMGYVIETQDSWVVVEGRALDTGRTLGGATAVVEYHVPHGATRPEDDHGQPLPLRTEVYAPADIAPGDTVQVLVSPVFAGEAVVADVDLEGRRARLVLFARVAFGVAALTGAAGLFLVVQVMVAARRFPQHSVQNPGRHQL
jgi:hypothetical protein